MSCEGLYLRREGATAELVINRPARKNALDAAFWNALIPWLDQVDADPGIRVLLLRGEGAHFSAGMDLDFFPSVHAQDGRDAARHREWLRRKVLALQAPINRLETLRVPVIAVTQGACIGGALDLICAANLRYATQDAFFRIHEIHIGMMADLGVLQRLPRLIAPTLVQELALTGRTLSADAALRAGLINGVAADLAGTLDLARQAAAQIAAHSPLAITGTKAALLHARDHRVGDGLEFVSLWNAAMFLGDDVPGAIAAQRERRVPEFQDLLP